MAKQRATQRGVTLIELMIVVAIIGILAGIAVYMYTKSAAKSRIESEVGAMFAEMEQRLNQYQLEQDGYPDLADETDLHPSTTGGKDPVTVDPLPTSWTDLRISPPKPALYCSYVIVTGEADDDTNLGTVIQSMGQTAAPETDWYYMLARCDADGDGTDYSYYARVSERNQLFKKDEGK